jgi:hypothetical protein
VAFVQPVLLIVAISLYTTAVSIANILVRTNQGQSRAGESEGNSPPQDGRPRPAPLDLPRRTGNDGY